MHKKVVAALCAVVLAGVGVAASVALGGEVKGPPGTITTSTNEATNTTGAPSHSHSICAFNGLNDLNPNQGQVTDQTQTPANQGIPGEAGAGPNAQQLGEGSPGDPTCGGGSNTPDP